MEGSVLSGSLSSLWVALVGLFACLNLVLAPCFLFSPFLGCFLSIKFGRVSSFCRLCLLYDLHEHAACYCIYVLYAHAFMTNMDGYHIVSITLINLGLFLCLPRR